MMSRLLCIFILAFTLIQSSSAQISEKIDLYISGGTSIPIESVVGKTFNFPQLNKTIIPDFAENALKLKPDVTNFSEFWKTGINVGAGLIYKFNNHLSVVTDFNYSNFVFNKNKLRQDVANFFADLSVIGLSSIPFNSAAMEINQGSIQMYQVVANLKAQVSMEFFRPYIIGGAGYLRINQAPININYYDEPYADVFQPISFYDQIPGANKDALVLNGGVGILFYLNKKFQPFIQASYTYANTQPDKTIYYPIRFGLNFSLN
jgi:opacity protein-like surface antigen